MREKTDSANFAIKVKLRELFLEQYHSEDPPHVLDCRQSSGALWKQLRESHKVASYWGVDKKPKPGRLAIDSANIVSTSTADVVDFGTYGSPWEFYRSLIKSPNKRMVSVFMTLGSIGVRGTDGGAYGDLLGLDELRLPASVLATIGKWENGLEFGIEAAYRYGWKIERVLVGVGTSRAVYAGVRLAPKRRRK